ncbi:MAG: DNA polymerase/3'-5' exonuclease PolX [Desulfosalsimonadaceae bacterium]
MIVHNNEVVEIFSRVADLMEIKGENPFRVRAYREAARVIGDLSEPVAQMVEEGRDLTEYKGIGKDLAEKIREIVKTGHLTVLDSLEKEIPPSLLDLMKIPDIGPKKAAVMYRELGIKNMEDLKQALAEGKISSVKGFGEKTEQKIFASISMPKKGSVPRMLRFDAEPSALAFKQYLEAIPHVDKVHLAGSFRRGKETVGDLDILAACREGHEEEVMDAFAGFEEVRHVYEKGGTKSSVLLRNDLQVDIRIVPEASYGAALHYFTGSKAHNLAIRRLAINKKLKINEYGVFDGSKQVAGKTEEAVYAAVGLPYIEPELRENLGEIEAAKEGKLPALIERGDIRGDLHMHTTRTDGRNSLAEMAQAAKALGYEYIAITEHSQKVAMANGLNEKDLRDYMDVIDAIGGEIDGITILKGIEVDILQDGSLDLPDSVLKELDIVIGSVHYQQRFPIKQQTKRIIKAMDNPYLQILGHPTGRLLNKREPMDIDLDSIIAAAAEKNVALELNAQPDRLDLPHPYCKLAADTGVKIVVSTDAHSTENLNRMKNGITEARRGWLTKDHVVNTRPLGKMLAMLRR